ncbi:hypothetical protein AAY473_009854 [Plecturocebus cupreus]
MHRGADTLTALEGTHKPTDKPSRSSDVGRTQGHAREHTGAARATRTPHTGSRAGPSAASAEKVAVLTQHVYLLIYINERLCRLPPPLGTGAAAFVPERDTCPDQHRGSPTLREMDGDYKSRGGGSRSVGEEGLQGQQPGTLTGTGEPPSPAGRWARRDAGEKEEEARGELSLILRRPQQQLQSRETASRDGLPFLN